VTLEELIRDGLNVEEIPPGTAVILHARQPLTADRLDTLYEQTVSVARILGVKIAVVSHDFDVLLVPEEYRTVNGVPPEQEIRR
jgi:hypothetical protein